MSDVGTDDWHSIAAEDVEEESSEEEWALHRACFYGDIERLKALLSQGVTREQFKELDPHGHTALHLAVLRKHKECVKLLLQAGCPAKTKSSETWRPAQEAAATRQRDLALMLTFAEYEQQRMRGKEKRRELMDHLSEMPDFALNLKWMLDSSVPGIGMLLKTFAPNDVYKVWKVGSVVRMDGTLKGVNNANDSPTPGFKRGHFSIVYDGTGSNSRGAFLDHEKKTYMDLKEVQHKGTDDIVKKALEKEVDELMNQKRLTRHKLKPKGFRFEPVRGWLSSELTERVEGWNTKVYDASVNMVKTTRIRGSRDLTKMATFEDYLAAELPTDVVQEVPINPYNPASYKKPKLLAAPPDPKQHGDTRSSPVSQSTTSKASHAVMTKGEPGNRSASVSQATRGTQPASAGSHRPSPQSSAELPPLPPRQQQQLLQQQQKEQQQQKVEKQQHKGEEGGGGKQHGNEGEKGERGVSKLEKGQKQKEGPLPVSFKATPEQLAHYKRLTGRCWMASKFPLSFQQVLPLLQLMGGANKHFYKVESFIANYSDRKEFPIRVDVPLILTVSIRLAFTHFELLSKPLPEGFFSTAPEGYTKKEPPANEVPVDEEQAAADEDAMLDEAAIMLEERDSGTI